MVLKTGSENQCQKTELIYVSSFWQCVSWTLLLHLTATSIQQYAAADMSRTSLNEMYGLDAKQAVNQMSNMSF